MKEHVEYKTASWWMGKDFYDLIKEMMINIVGFCGQGDTRNALRWVKILARHVTPQFKRINEAKRKEIKEKMRKIQEEVFSSREGDHASLYDDPAIVEKNVQQMDLIMDFYEELLELMDYHNMFIPKSEVIDESDPYYLDRAISTQL
jgi:hypothetical protein